MLRENTVNPNVQKAVEVLGRLSLNGRVRQEAKIREDALFNERSALSAARKEGREEERLKMVNSLRALGVSEEQIREAIRLSERDDAPIIEELSEEIETENLET